MLDLYWQNKFSMSRVSSTPNLGLIMGWLVSFCGGSDKNGKSASSMNDGWSEGQH